MKIPAKLSGSKSFAFQLDPTRYIGLSSEIYNNIDELLSVGNPFWLHFDSPSKHLQQQLSKKLNINKAVSAILFSEDQRPRCIKIENGFMLIVQGIQPSGLTTLEDPPSLRICISSDRLLSISTGSISAVTDMKSELLALENPTLMLCLITLLEYLVYYLEEAAYQLDEQLDQIEMDIENIDCAIEKITEIRQRIVRFRRYVLPQRDAVIFLANKIEAISTPSVLAMKELSDTTTRLAEMLEMLRERAAILQDGLANQIGEVSNRRMYLLTIIMLVFTPAFFIMSLFSMYVPIPGMNSKITWWAVLLFIVVSSMAQIFLFKKRKWL